MNKKWILDDAFIILTDSTGHKTNYSQAIFKYIVKTSSTDFFKNTYNLSQDEIDQIIQEMTENKIKDEQIEFNFAPGFNWQEDKPKIEIKCPPHEWIEYLGLNERFLHCKLCGEKK